MIITIYICAYFQCWTLKLRKCNDLPGIEIEAGWDRAGHRFSAFSSLFSVTKMSQVCVLLLNW